LPGFLEYSEQTPEPNGTAEVSRRKKRAKGYNGEADPNAVPPPPTNGASSPQVHVSRSPNAVSVDGSVDPLFTTQRTVDTLRRNDGSVELHVSVRCSLGDIAKATNLRVEDAAFALHECGLLGMKLSDEESGDRLLISGALVEKVAAERKVKEPCINLAHVKL
jgi:histone acetyltransferase HTATIP/histone acetyltransferase MYST1